MIIFDLNNSKLARNKDDNYINEEIELFKTVVERGLPPFYRLARNDGK